MAVQFIINLLVAFIWALLQDQFTFLNLSIGFIIGLVLLYVFRKTMGTDCYAERMWILVKLFAFFVKEVIVANVIVVRQVLAPKLNIRPGIFALPLDVKTDAQITILACMISLTPGTLSMHVSDDRKYLFVHSIDIENADAMIKQIKNTFEKGILEVAEGC